MKELTIEQKAKAYDEAIKKAKDMLSYKEVRQEDIEYLFPELKESEDESIRKALIKYFSYEDGSSHALDNITFKQILAWLEKQGEHKKFRDFIQIGDKVTRNESGELVNLSQLERIAKPRRAKPTDKIKPKFKHGDRVKNKKSGVTQILGSCIEDVYEGAFPFRIKEQDNWELVEQKSANKIEPKDYNSIDPHFGKFIDNVEPKFKVGDSIKTTNEAPLTITKITDSGYWSEDLFICNFGNADKWELVEQKPSNKVEPKFHVGEWITDGNITIQIEAIKNDCYLYCGDCILYSTKIADKVYHLWTIEDAKDGDVLVCPKYAGDIIPNIFIFKNIEIKDNDVYCYCSFLKVFMTGGYIANADPINTDFYPATKEQRDILFAKIIEAGYEWDADKKELKRIVITDLVKDCITQEPTEWSEEDESILQGIWDEILTNKHNAKEYEWKTYDKFLDWLKSLKNRVQPKVEWNEEDEDMFYKTISVINRLCAEGKEYVWSINTLKKLFYWLKSLKNKYTWKPSDEQLEALESATENCAYSEYQDCLRELLKQLKKLREE